ncbi:MAG TPA: carboxypeptidase-like regulatory domain-containing protein [Solirubrobacteraceae bacterium]|nr:carboxypeptidase-like regulatory domain-containing protein [Solirubrobacteraceae bacterium]
MTVNNGPMEERMLHQFNRGWVGVAFVMAGVIGLLLAATVTVGASTAYAGQWIQASCSFPDGTTASSEGWTGFAGGPVGSGASNTTKCDSHYPMGAWLGTAAPAPAGALEELVYSPPGGSTLVGGRLSVGLVADGYGRADGTPGKTRSAIGSAAIMSPAFGGDDNLVKHCEFGLTCQINGLEYEYYGNVDLPPNRGGSVVVVASCVGDPNNATCYQGGPYGSWSWAAVAWAHLLLSSSSLPTAGDFRGDLLEPGAHGTAGLAFTAADNGPGVYKVKVTIDDKPVYDATPNTNSGRCVTWGPDPGTGALYFEWQQPCPRSEIVDMTVRTTTLSDGPHELKVTILNAAQNSSTVLRRTITTNNRTTVSAKLTSDKPAPGSVTHAPAPVYAVELDAATKKLVGGVGRGWSQSGLTLSGTLRNGAGVAAPGVLVTLFSRNASQTAHEAVARATTDAAGHWSLAAPRGPSRLLTISYGEQPDPAAPQAIRFRQTVKPGVTLRVQALGHGRLRFSGKLSIKPLGTPRPLVAIQTRTRNGKHWQAVGSSLRVKAAGNYSVTYDGGPNVVGGSYAFRSVVNATPLFSTGISPIRRKVVR